MIDTKYFRQSTVLSNEERRVRIRWRAAPLLLRVLYGVMCAGFGAVAIYGVVQGKLPIASLLAFASWCFAQGAFGWTTITADPGRVTWVRLPFLPWRRSIQADTLVKARVNDRNQAHSHERRTCSVLLARSKGRPVHLVSSYDHHECVQAASLINYATEENRAKSDSWLF